MRFEKKIKKELDKDIPSDGYEKIMAKAEEAGYFQKEETVPAGGGAAVIKKNNKPFFFTLCAFLLAVAVSLCIVLPLVLKKSDVRLPIINRVELSVSDFYGTGAVTSVKLLSVSEQNRMSRASDKNQNSVNEQIQYFNKYLTAFDEFLGDGFVTTEVKDNDNQDYGRYKYAMSVTNFSDEDGYTMYFNETLVKEDDDEITYVLDGVMNVGGREYLLSGERSSEDDGDESEEELKIRAYTPEDPSTYVEMEQEFSVEDGEREVEYVYRVYSNNKLVEETSVEFETEIKNGKSQTEFELEFKNGVGKGKYKLEKEVKNGVCEMSVKYTLNGVGGKFKIYETVKDGVPYYEYVFEDGSKELIKK